MSGQRWSVLGLAIVVAALIVSLAVIDPSEHAQNIVVLIGLLGLAMSNLAASRDATQVRDHVTMTGEKVDQLDRTVRNGGMTHAVRTALHQYESERRE